MVEIVSYLYINENNRIEMLKIKKKNRISGEMCLMRQKNAIWAGLALDESKDSSPRLEQHIECGDVDIGSQVDVLFGIYGNSLLIIY